MARGRSDRCICLFPDFDDLKRAQIWLRPGIRILRRGWHRVIFLRADGEDVVGLRIERNRPSPLNGLDGRDQTDLIR